MPAETIADFQMIRADETLPAETETASGEKEILILAAIVVAILLLGALGGAKSKR